MSLSPSPHSKRNARSSSKSADTDPLTRAQSLLITAGIAGLVGLCSGGFLRFSLANSPNARFLSPLQTFPALSDWTSEMSTETADTPSSPEDSKGEQRRSNSYSEGVQSESTILTFEPAEPVDGNQSRPIDESLNTEIDASSKPTDTTTFDSFANRGKGRRRTAAPLDLLKKGPDLSGVSGGLSQPAPDLFNQGQIDQGQIDRGELYEENAQGDIYDDSERYANEYDNSYRDDSYYGDNSYDSDNYYPPTDESLDRDDAYYEQGRW